MIREITAHGSSEEDVSRMVELELIKYGKYSILEKKIIGPARTPAGGLQYTAIYKVEIFSQHYTTYYN
jgi:hypothetical protein